MKDLIFDWIKNFYGLSKEVTLEFLISHPGFDSHKYWWMLGLFAGVAALFGIIWFFTRQVLVGVVNSFASKTKTELDDILVKNRFFGSLAHLVPLLFLDYLFEIAFFASPKLLDFSERVSDLLIVLVVLISARRFLNAVGDVLSKKPSLQ